MEEKTYVKTKQNIQDARHPLLLLLSGQVTSSDRQPGQTDDDDAFLSSEGASCA